MQIQVPAGDQGSHQTTGGSVVKHLTCMLKIPLKAVSSLSSLSLCSSWMFILKPSLWRGKQQMCKGSQCSAHGCTEPQPGSAILLGQPCHFLQSTPAQLGRPRTDYSQAAREMHDKAQSQQSHVHFQFQTTPDKTIGLLRHHIPLNLCLLQFEFLGQNASGQPVHCSQW